MRTKEAVTFTDEVQALASGQAALLLVEALIHDLIESRAITTDRAIDTVQTITETKQQLLTDGYETEIARCAVGKLLVIENTLRALQSPER